MALRHHARCAATPQSQSAQTFTSVRGKRRTKVTITKCLRCGAFERSDGLHKAGRNPTSLRR
jgi:hypothetical protein